MKKKILDDAACQRILKDYTNDKSLVTVQARRIENHSDELAQILDQYAEEIGPVLEEYNKTSSRKTMMLMQNRASSVRTQNRRIHQDMVEGIAVECAKKLGLNVGLTRLIARNHDIGHTFSGHCGENWISDVKARYGLGVFTHNSVGPKELIYRHRIYDEIMERIQFYNPTIGAGTLDRLRKGLWLIFDGMNSHNGELSELEFRPNLGKTEKDFEEEMMGCHTEKGFDRKIVPATIEGCLLRNCDKIAYTPFDMVDGLNEGIIDGIGGEYVDVLTSLGISKEEINEANVRRQYEKIARKLQIIFARSLIEHSSKSVITMEPNVCRLMHEMRNINNREVVNFQLIQEDEATYPKAIDILANGFAELIQKGIGFNSLRYMSENLELARQVITRYQGTQYEDFAVYIAGTTPEMYNFNSKMIERIAEQNGEELSDQEYKRRMALEFGLNYMATLSDEEFMNLMVTHGLVADGEKKSLTRSYRELGRERLMKEQSVHENWKKISAEQAAETAKMGSTGHSAPGEDDEETR